MPRTLQSTARVADRAYLVAADTPGALLPAEESLQELAELAKTAGADVVGSATQKLDHPNPATYIGKGKVDEVVEARKQLGANVVIFDDEYPHAKGERRGRVRQRPTLTKFGLCASTVTHNS